MLKCQSVALFDIFIIYLTEGSKKPCCKDSRAPT